MICDMVGHSWIVTTETGPDGQPVYRTVCGRCGAAA